MPSERDPNRNPFPMATPKGRVIVDESCSCGHKRTEHGPTLAFGHGPCRLAGCSCARFTWSGMLFLDEIESELAEKLPDAKAKRGA